MATPPDPTKPEADKPRLTPDNGREWLKYTGIAAQLLGTILVFVFGGVYLDEWLETDPWLTVILSLVGVTAGLYVSLKDFL